MGGFGARARAWSRVDLRRTSWLSPLAPLFRARCQLGCLVFVAVPLQIRAGGLIAQIPHSRS